MTKLKFENPVFRSGMQQTIRKGEKPIHCYGTDPGLPHHLHTP